jgi:hypothetical protein
MSLSLVAKNPASAAAVPRVKQFTGTHTYDTLGRFITAFTDKSDSNISYPAAIAMDSFFYNISSPPLIFCFVQLYGGLIDILYGF